MKNRPLLTLCLMLLAVIILGVTVGKERCVRQLQPSPLETNVPSGEEITVCGTVYQTEQKTKVQAIYLKGSSIRWNQTSFYENKLLVYTDPEVKVKIGNKIQVSGETAFFDEARNPGNFDQKLYYQKMDIHGLIWADRLRITDGSIWKLRNGLAVFRAGWREMLEQYMGAEDGSALAAMMLGEKSGMDAEVKSLYQASGIGHILAISGLHLSFLGLGTYRILRRCAGSYGISGFAGILILMIYVLMIGFTVSVVRSLIMFLFRVGADMTGRHYDAPTALAVSAAAVLFWRPLYLYDGGFWLSFLAVLAMILLLPEFQGLPFQGLWASLCVNLMLLPVLLYYFFEFPIYSTLLNLFVVPLTSVLLVLGMAGSAACLPFPAAGGLVLKVCGLILALFEKSCEWMLALPGARWVAGCPGLWQIAVYYGVLLLSFFLWKKYKKAGMLFLYGIGVLVLAGRVGERGVLSVTFLDVGQGDSIFIRGPQGDTFLVDGGSSDVSQVGRYRMEPFLKSQGTGCLDYVWITHGDEDHVNGVEELLKRQKIGVRIKALVLPEKDVWDERLEELGRLAEDCGTSVYVMEEDQTIEKNGLVFTCLGPGGPAEEEEIPKPGNAASLVLALQYRGFDMLLTGDIEGKGEAALTDKLARGYADTSWEVLKAAHHGSKNSTGEEFLEIVKPQYAVISAGRENRYGHPHPETLERLKEAGACICSTQNLGAVTIQVVEFEMKIQYTIKGTD